MSELYSIDPFKLLGLTQKSTLLEAKKAYYNYALLTHPDKGGSSEQMIVITNAYNYVKKQLDFVDSKKDLSYEGLEEEFADFCKQQTDKPPTFSYIYEETNDWIKEINKEFTELKKANDNNPFDKGYGEFMDKSEVNDEYNCCEDKNVNNDFTDAIVEYKEPVNLPDQVTSYPLNTKNITDFSSNSNNISMTDYKKAFSPKNKIDSNIDLCEDINKKFKNELNIRNLN